MCCRTLMLAGSRSIACDRTTSQSWRREPTAGLCVIVRWRTNSAHLHRPWRAKSFISVTGHARTPRFSSSIFTRALTLERLTPSALAAWRKFRYSATVSVWISDARECATVARSALPIDGRSSVLNAIAALSAHPHHSADILAGEANAASLPCLRKWMIWAVKPTMRMTRRLACDPRRSGEFRSVTKGWPSGTRRRISVTVGNISRNAVRLRKIVSRYLPARPKLEIRPMPYPASSSRIVTAPIP